MKDVYTLRPRYGEVDQMGYVYHANYVSYCHVARTEMFRKIGLCDADIEERGYMMPVVEFNIKYKQPAHYDELLYIKTTLEPDSKVKLKFTFKMEKEDGTLVCEGNSQIVFVHKETRKPLRVPSFFTEKVQERGPA